MTYTTAGGTPTCATPTFNPATGTYAQTQSVEISCATDGATIYYTTDGEDPTTESDVYTSALTISETTTVKAMAVAEGYNNSAIATATYTIQQPITIAAARTQGSGSVFTTGTVTSCVGTTGYIQDATAAICVFGSSLTVGDEIIVSGTLTTYNGLMEITNPVVNVVSSGNTVIPTVKTIAEINADDYTSSSSIQGLYVTIEEATVTAINGQNTTIAQGDNTIVVRGISGVEYAVNDVITLDGNIGCFNAAQIANPQNVTVQTSGEPAILVEPLIVNVPCAAAEGTLTVTYQNIDEVLGAEIYWYESDGTTTATYDWVDAEFDGDNNVYYVISANTGEARTAYMKVYGIGTDGSDVFSDLITFSQGHYIADYATLPFSFDGGLANIGGTPGLTQEGLGSDYNNSPKLKFDSTGDWLILHFNEEPGTMTFDIKGNSFSGSTFTVQTSEDGETYTDLATYTELGATRNVEFNTLGENVRYIKWIYTEKVGGNVALGNIVLEQPATAPVITIDPDTVEVDAEEHDGTLTVTYLNLGEEITAEVVLCDAEGAVATYDWFSAELNEDNNVYYVIEANDGEARTAYFKVYALDANANDVYSNIVTVSQAAYVAPAQPGNWVLTELADLTAGDVFVIVGTNDLGEHYYAMSNDKGTSEAPTAVAVTVVNNTLSGEIADNLQWNLTISNSGYTFYPVGSASTWLYCTNGNNGVRVGTNNNSVFVMDGGYLKHVATSRFVGIYNSQDWRCYTSNSGSSNIAGQTFAFYKKVSDDVTYSKTVTAYEGDGGYVLIASPVASVTPSASNGFLTSEYDLYYFDQSEDQEWRNYEAGAFNLTSGKGYLYASSTDTQLTFTGQPYNGNGVVALDYDADAALAGWNLVGNPFDAAATCSKAFYRLNSDGSEVNAETETGSIAAMEGVFVVAEASGETITFTKGGSAKVGEMVVMNVIHNRGNVIDRAIVRFDEGSQLPKFQLFQNSTKLFIPQGDNDYAIVRSANQGEMPVNFKARENGTYTLAVETENVEMDYLHLIDNKTGMDVDLLQTPSYTFEATTRDYASRFRLVFSANDNNAEGNAHFAYFNGSEWQISNKGEATLQVVDVMGRIVKNMAIEDNATVSINEMPGVYMMRLLNGNDVKVQKVIIK